MNHHYPDNYHGYVRGAAGMQNISYGHGVYEEQMTMGQMGQSRNSYQVPQYRDSGQMHPLMQHHQQNSMYPSGGYMGQMNASSYGMSGYSNYGMPSQASMNSSSQMMMGPRGNMMGGYYNHPMDSQASPRTQVPGPTTSYNQSTSGNSLHCQNQMNHMPASQNCSPQATPMQGGQVSHCASPHGMTAAHSNSGFQRQGSAVNHGMIPGAQGQQHSMTGNRSGSSIHPIPQHPMRHPSTQQNPQEVADNILQIASSYPANQTVQVPLKSRHAPYHIPRSPHYSMSSSDHGHSSPMTSHSQQASPAPQPSPTPSSSSVKSPTPSLGPIPNPIPSPGISGLRSPCNQGALACGAQRSPAHMASSYSGHSQPSPSPHHFSPTGIGNQQNFSPFTQSPTAPRSTGAPYSHSQDQNIFTNSDNQDLKPSYSSPLPPSNSPHSQNIMPSDMPPSSNVQFSQQGKGNNPLMSLQKLVMLPETQVVDPKSVVNDACLSSQSNENEEFPKNGEDPAEGCAESSDSSVGCPGQSSSHISHSTEQTQPESEPKVSSPGLSLCPATNTLAKDSSEAIENSDSTSDKAPQACVEHSGMDEKTPKPVCLEQKEEPGFHTNPASPSHQEDTGFNTAVNSSEGDLSVEKKCVSEVETPCDGLHRQNEKSKEIPETKSNESPDPTDISVKSQPVNATNMSKSNDNSSEQQNDNMLHSLKHTNGKVNGLNEDVKHPFPCKSSGVLSEVPLLVNGLSTSGGVSDGNEHDSDGDVERKLQNGFSSRLRSKLRIGEKTGQFIRLTTPCSIAVGADERAMCERFALRRNDYCHTLRTSRLLYNGRIRQDSTGNGDSDESIENVSDGSFHVLGNPQDGCKKKTSASAKRNEARNSTVNNSSHHPKKDGLVSHRDGQVGNSSNNHVSNSNEHNPEASDEDGEVCYYEGVDSSDFFMHTVSSDDSISSSQEVKQTSQNNSSTSANPKAIGSGSKNKEISQEDEKKNLNENISSPPLKRPRRSPGHNSVESVQEKMSSSRCISNTSNKEPEIGTGTSAQTDLSELDLKNQNNCQENGKINRTRLSRRKSPAPKEKQFTNNQHKLPEVVVRLEKSPIVERGPIKVEPVENLGLSIKKEKISPIVIDDSSPEKCAEMACTKSDVQGSVELGRLEEKPSIKDDAVRIEDGNKKVNSVIKSEVVTDSGAVNVTACDPSAAPIKVRLPSKKKRTCKKRKKPMSSVRNKDKKDELKDSFKSMKFSRTLDMMKSHKKKESSSTGPFLRIEGSRNAPNTVSVFNQSSQDFLPLANKQKHNHRQSFSRGSTTVHMVSSLANDKTVMVSSNKVVPNQHWSCAFCSHQSSFQSLGDLFGPYFKEADLPAVESIVLEEGKKGDSSKDSPKSSNISSAKVKASPADKKGSRKRKLSSKTEQCLPQEIWLHESCALWAPGVYLIGNRIYGLDDAIRDTAETTCSVCKGKGAMIGCLYKGCAMKYHFACAIEKDCHLDEGNFSLLCPKHKDKKFNMAPPSSSSSVKKES